MKLTSGFVHVSTALGRSPKCATDSGITSLSERSVQNFRCISRMTSSTPNIRLARADDYSQYVRLFAFVDSPSPCMEEEVFKASLRNMLVVPDRADCLLIAYLYWEKLSECRIAVRNLVVDPEHRRQGLATQVVLHLENLLPPQITAVGLYVESGNAPARSLYTHLGFRDCHVMRLFRVPRKAVELRASNLAVVELAPESESRAIVSKKLDIDEELMIMRHVSVYAVYNNGEWEAAALRRSGDTVVRVFRANNNVAGWSLLSALVGDAEGVKVAVEKNEEFAKDLIRAGADVLATIAWMEKQRYKEPQAELG